MVSTGHLMYKDNGSQSLLRAVRPGATAAPQRVSPGQQERPIPGGPLPQQCSSSTGTTPRTHRQECKFHGKPSDTNRRNCFPRNKDRAARLPRPYSFLLLRDM